MSMKAALFLAALLQVASSSMGERSSPANSQSAPIKNVNENVGLSPSDLRLRIPPGYCRIDESDAAMRGSLAKLLKVAEDRRKQSGAPKAEIMGISCGDIERFKQAPFDPDIKLLA
jgi:hypothetical protein